MAVLLLLVLYRLSTLLPGGLKILILNGSGLQIQRHGMEHPLNRAYKHESEHPSSRGHGLDIVVFVRQLMFRQPL